MPEAVPGHPQPQPLTLRGMQFELGRVGCQLHRLQVCAWCAFNPRCVPAIMC